MTPGNGAPLWEPGLPPKVTRDSPIWNGTFEEGGLCCGELGFLAAEGGASRGKSNPSCRGLRLSRGVGGGVSGGRGRSRPQTGVPLRPVWGVGVSDAHLYPILGEEGPGVRLRGKLEAGGISPERAAPKEQARGPVLAAAVALAKEVWVPERKEWGEDGREEEGGWGEQG